MPPHTGLSAHMASARLNSRGRRGGPAGDSRGAATSPAAGGALVFTGSSLVGQFTFLRALVTLVGLEFVVMSRQRSRPAA